MSNQTGTKCRVPRSATRGRVSAALAVCLTWLLAAPADGQDMPLTQVLLPGEGWERVADGYGFTDGCCNDAEGNFYFSDVSQGKSIMKIDTEGRLSVFVEDAAKISAMQFGPDGRLYACQVGQFGRIVAFNANGSMSVIAENVRPNDLVVTSDGVVYFTETAKQQVTRIKPGGKPERAAGGVNRPNGIALTPDEGTLLVSDHGGRYGWVWRIEPNGDLSHQQPYMTLRTIKAEAPAKGDGSTTDAAGRFYITSEAGLQMFDPTGRMGGVIATPNPSKPLVSVEFAGPGLSQLFVANGDAIYRRQTKTRGVAINSK